MQITVREDFKSLIPELTADELKQLEQNILSEGVRDPLVLWGDTLIDGHHRYEIAQRHGLKFQTVQREFESEADAQQWIILNQFGRRNLSAYDRSILALKLKPMLAAEAKKRQGKRNIPPKSAGSEVRDQLAKAANVSHDTIAKVEKIEAQGTPELKERVKRGELSINKAWQEIRQTKQQEPKPVKEPVQTNKPDRKRACIADYLSEGRENAVTARYLANILGVYPSNIRAMVHKERMGGSPIVATPQDGYYLGSESEARLFCRKLRARAKEIEAAASGIEAGAVTA